MATAKATRYKKQAAVAVELPECPVCMETMTAPIFQCQSGHSLCSRCSSNLVPAKCPLCRQPMTHMRNWQLEEIVQKNKVPCPNKSAGCVYTMAAMDVDVHLKECIFREMECPHGAVFGKCSWTGKIKEMMDHFKERHPESCNISSDNVVNLNDVSVTNDDRHLYLVALGKMQFTLTMKIDTLQKMAYWTVQHIGSKSVAQQHTYEIHVVSQKDERRQVTFVEHCFNDAVKADEVFRQAKCAVLPLEMLNHFIKDKKLSFRFVIKRHPPAPKNNKNQNEVNNQNYAQFMSRSPIDNYRGSKQNEGNTSSFFRPGRKGPGAKHFNPKEHGNN